MDRVAVIQMSLFNYKCNPGEARDQDRILRWEMMISVTHFFKRLVEPSLDFLLSSRSLS